MKTIPNHRRALLALLAAGLPLVAPAAPAVTAVDFSSTVIYHSPQSPGFTCWVGAWMMPDDSVMVAFTQATGVPTVVDWYMGFVPFLTEWLARDGMEFLAGHRRNGDVAKLAKDDTGKFAARFTDVMNQLKK